MPERVMDNIELCEIVPGSKPDWILEKLGIESWPSEANFILARTGSEVFDALLARGIIVRPMKGFGLTEHVRISVGLPEDNERLIKALGEIRGMDAAKREAGP